MTLYLTLILIIIVMTLKVYGVNVANNIHKCEYVNIDMSVFEQCRISAI